MIRLSLLTAPVEVDLAAAGYPGVSLTLRRLTAPELAEARDATVSILREARKGLEALKPYGLDGADAAGQRLNPADPDQMIRAGTLVGGVEIAVRAIQAWTGITLDEAGTLAPISRETLSILLQDDAIQRRIMKEVEAAARILVTEGNASGPSPAGSSATRPVTKAAPPTAGTAGGSKSRARAASRAAPAPTAPKSKAPRKPSRARPSGGSSSAPASG